MDTIGSYIRSHQERFLEELQQFLRFPSISAQPNHKQDVEDCARWLQKHLAVLGCQASLVDKGGHPVLIAHAPGQTERRVVIYGHYDVQPEDPLDQWKSPPFEPALRDGHIYARGATDDKGQLFAHIKALEALLKTQEALPSGITFVIEGEEESGGDSLTRYVREEGADLQPELVIISDGTMYDTKTPAINYGLRGILVFECVVEGPNSDVHSGAYGGAIANPAMVMAQLLASCLDSQGRITIPGFYDHVAPMQDWERENIRKLGFDEQTLLADTGSRALFGEFEFSSLERIWARPTFEINGLYGGYQGPHSKTIIPAQATAKVSIRLVPDQDPEQIRTLVFDFLRRNCPDTVRFNIPEFAYGPPVCFDTQHPAFNAARAALRKGFGRDCVFTRCGGSIPVVSTFAQQWDCPILLMGLGQDNDAPHSPNERFKLDSFFKGIKASAHLLLNL